MKAKTWLSLIMVAITHTTTADASFSAAGAAAWNTGHAITGLASVASTNDYNDLSNTPSIPATSAAWPIGAVFISRVTTSPTTLLGFGTWSLVGQGQVLVGIQTGSAEFGTLAQTGGATGIASTGTVSQPTFTGDNYTPSGTNSTVSYTPSGTIDMTLYFAKGTNSTSAFTPSGSVAWPGSVPQLLGTAFTASASVNWPAGNAVFTGVVHRHELPIVHTDNTIVRFLPTATFGAGGTSRVPDVRATVTNVLVADVTNSGVVLLSNTATASGTNAWPASVPQAVVSATPAGTISWPAGVPAFNGGVGTVPAQIFTGATGSGSAVFTGVAGTISAQAFTGVAKAPTGTVSKPTYVGDKTSVLQPYLVVYFWERTA